MRQGQDLKTCREFLFCLNADSGSKKTPIGAEATKNLMPDLVSGIFIF
jgi:hypothetical protein